MARTKQPLEEPIFDEEKAAEVKRILSEAKAAILNSLPAEMLETRAAQKRAWQARTAKRRGAKAVRQKHLLEILLTGHTQAEIARVIGQGESTVSSALKVLWPFDPPGGANRYIVIRISPSLLTNLDALAGDMLLSRSRALEKVAAAALEESAAVARRTLHVIRSSEG